MTTKDAIKLLPLEEKLKMQVLNLYDYMEPDQKLTVEVIAWKSYFMMHERLVEVNLEKELDAAQKGQANLGPDFYKNVLKKTQNEETKHMADKAQTVDLAAARQAMEQIVNEIRSAKKTPKTKH